MLNLQITLLLFLLSLIIDVFVTAAKIGFTNTRYEKLLTSTTYSEKARQRAAEQLSHRSRLIFNMQTSHVALRFLLAGLSGGYYLLTVGTDFSYLGLLFVIAAVGLVTALVEQMVESTVLLDPEKWAILLAGFTRIIILFFTPILVIPLLVSKVLPAQPKRFFRVTEDELTLILDASAREGVLEVDEREMINSIFLFRDKSVREIMIPRIDLLALNVETPLLQAIDMMLESGYSRVPVYEDSIDNVLGVLYIKDLLRLYREGKDSDGVRNNLRSAYFIPETKKVGELLAEMQAERNHIAIIVDEYGGVAGIVTLEDIVEEIVGEIQDEYDQAEEVLAQKVNDDEYVFQAKIDINEFNQIMGTELPKETADTLGGLLYSWFGRIPKTGESTESDDILFTVEQVTGRRIRKVRATRSMTAEAPPSPSQDPAWY